MGHHRIEINMIGGHGCDRTAKEGETRTFCGLENCPDCAVRTLVEAFRKRGCFDNGTEAERNATITHWPGDGEIVDDLLSGVRHKGSFSR